MNRQILQLGYFPVVYRSKSYIVISNVIATEPDNHNCEAIGADNKRRLNMEQQMLRVALGRAVKHNGTRPSGQFSSTSCVRCNGLLVAEWNYDLQNPDEHNIETLRCVQCGNRIDPVILQNRTRVPVRNPTVRLPRPRQSSKIVSLGEVA
jgi:hypothetical protein